MESGPVAAPILMNARASIAATAVPAPKPMPASKGRGVLIGGIVALAALLIGGIYLASVIFRVELPEGIVLVEIGDSEDSHFREQFDDFLAESLAQEENELMEAITENESRKTDSHSSGRSSSCASEMSSTQDAPSDQAHPLEDAEEPLAVPPPDFLDMDIPEQEEENEELLCPSEDAHALDTCVFDEAHALLPSTSAMVSSDAENCVSGCYACNPSAVREYISVCHVPFQESRGKAVGGAI